MDFLSRLSDCSYGSAYDFITNRMDDILQAVLSAKMFDNLLSFFKPIGIAILVLYWLLDTMDKVTADNYSGEAFLYQMIKFLPGYILIANIDLVIPAMLDFIVALNSEIVRLLKINSVVTQDGGIITKMLQVISRGSVMNNTGFGLSTSIIGDGPQMIETGLGVIYGFVMQFFILYLSISRAIKICCRSVLAPISIADIYHNGASSSGMTQLKKLFALFLQSTVVLILCVTIDVITLENSITAIIAGVICLFILVGALKHTEKFTNELMGVH